MKINKTNEILIQAINHITKALGRLLHAVFFTRPLFDLTTFVVDFLQPQEKTPTLDIGLDSMQDYIQN